MRGNIGPYMSAVLNVLRLEGHLQILSHGHGPPLQIVSWKIAQATTFIRESDIAGYTYLLAILTCNINLKIILHLL